MTNHTWRVFIAIELDAEVRHRITAHVQRLRELLPEVQAGWTRPENIHLTLKFLGDTLETHIDKVSAATAMSVDQLEPFRIAVGASGVFPARSVPKVLWIGIDDLEGRLAELHARLEEQCRVLGFKKEKRPFHPHLTIARLRKPSDARRLAAAHTQIQFEPIEFIASEVSVIRSELSSAGSRYTAIAKHPLRAE